MKSLPRLVTPADWPPLIVISEGLEGSPGAVLQAGMMTKRRPWMPGRAMRVFGKYALVYVIEGEGWFYQGSLPPRRVTAGDMLVLFPDVAHAYGPEEGGVWRELYLVFAGPMFDLWRKRGSLEPARSVLAAMPLAHWTGMFQRVIPPRCPAEAADALAAACRLLEMLAMLGVAERTGTPNATQPEWLAQACRQLAGSRRPGVPQVAREAGLSYDNFRKRFAAATGYSPARFRLLRRIEQACRMIREQRDLPLKEVADILGFADEFHFSKRFKEITGMPPGTFRQLGG